MISRICQFLYARFRAFAPLSCFMSPRTDILRGWARWRWLARNRREGREIEPSVRVQGDLTDLEERLKFGKGCQIDLGCIFWLGSAQGRIEVVEMTYIGPYTFIGSHEHTVRIGRDCMIGANCYLITANHATKSKGIPYREQGYTGADITLGDNVWLGCHVTILPGVTIGDGAIIGAGAVVNKDVPAGETWGGVPARRLHGATETKS